MCDLLITGGIVVDPTNRFHGPADVAIDNGAIVAVGPDLDRMRARRVVRASGKWVLPGLVDSHVHLSGRAQGHRMMARAGVTCALDLAGRPEDIVGGLRVAGAGLTVGFVFPLIPGETIADADPGETEIRTVVDEALRQGALGVKVVGGHYPLTPDATARVIAVANERGAWCAIHAGTLATRSNIEGLEELVELSAGLPLHIAHINSYCRGQITGDPLIEASRALRALAQVPAAWSESYLSLMNGTSGAMESGVPRSRVTRTCLTSAGYGATEVGMEAAIADGWARVHSSRAGEIVLLPRAEGLRDYREGNTEVWVSFPVNSPGAAIALAIARAEGGFAVDGLSTDGGGIPRNTTLRQGLALVRFGALSPEELVVKACVNPARALGLDGKGHISPGADADVIVVDPDTGQTEWAMLGGITVVEEGRVVGRRGQLLTTEAGRAFLDGQGVESTTVVPEWLG